MGASICGFVRFWKGLAQGGGGASGGDIQRRKKGGLVDLQCLAEFVCGPVKDQDFARGGNHGVKIAPHCEGFSLFAIWQG